MKKLPMTPAEFDEARRALVRMAPWLSETSGRRSSSRNQAVNGNPQSKHLIGMAQDFGADTSEGLYEGAIYAETLGLWHIVHDKGSGNHLHIQGLPPGKVPKWWLEKYGDST